MDEFTKAVQLWFGLTDYEDPSKALTHLKQTTTVVAYQEAFEKLSHWVDDLPQRFLIGSFIAGLRDDIHIDVKIKQPDTLADTIGVARLIEERNQLQRRPNQQLRSHLAFATPKASPNPIAGVLGPPPTQRINQSSNTQLATFHRITNQEARERQEKGLCYYCDEKFIPSHRCEWPQLFMIEDSPHIGIADVEVDQPKPEPHDTLPEISFHAITSTNHPQTIHVLSKLKNKNVKVLIDGGSTHNFIDQVIVSKFGLPVIQDKKFQVMVANREKIERVGHCWALTLTIQGLPVTVDYCTFCRSMPIGIGNAMPCNSRTHQDWLQVTYHELQHGRNFPHIPWIRMNWHRSLKWQRIQWIIRHRAIFTNNSFQQQQPTNFLIT